MSDTSLSTAGAAHCTLLPAISSEEVAAPLPRERKVAHGAALSASTQRMQCDELVAFEAGLLGEELTAVLEGRVDIVAADEHYVLSAGEAILIPPHEARRYRCVTPGCVLYRVVCNAAPNEEPQK